MKDIKMLQEKQPETILLFLKEFTKELILSMKKLYPERFEKPKPSIKQEKMQEPKHEMIPSMLVSPVRRTKPWPQPRKQAIVRPSLRLKYAIPTKPPYSPAPSSLPKVPSIRPQPSRFQYPIQTATLAQGPSKILPTEETQAEVPPAMRKINALLSDRLVSSVECQGPGKPLVIRRAGKIQISGVILNEQEIQEIINYFSEKARIPVVDGMLKAAVENLVISAVVSEVVGSRFIITKQHYTLLEPR